MGFDSAFARNDSDNELFGEFNAFLDNTLPPDPKLEDFADFNQFLRAPRPHCWDLPGWARTDSYPHFCELRRRALNSISFHMEFLNRRCFVGKHTWIGHDYVLYKGSLWTLDIDLCMDDCTSVLDEILRRERQKIDYF